MNVAIVGSRNYPDLRAVQNYVSNLPPDTTIVSGGARGVDRTAETVARNLGMKVISVPANWDLLGKRAGFIRNEDIVNCADRVVAFWDGKSRGTRHSIEFATGRGKHVEVHFPDGTELPHKPGFVTKGETIVEVWRP